VFLQLIYNQRCKQLENRVDFKDLEFIRYELSKKFLSILFAFEFDRVRAQLKWQSLVVILQVFSSLLMTTSKES